MNPHIRLTLIGILTTFAAACGGGGGSKTLTPSDFCTMKASAECSGTPTNCALSPMACTAARTTACNTFSAKAMVGPRVFVPGNISACISTTTSVYKKALILAADLDQVNDTCNYVFQGDVADLAACTTKYDCKTKSDICDKGHCAAKMTVGANAQCPSFGAVCGATQYCTTMGAAMICVDKIGQGKACDAATPCNDTMMLTCTGGVCVKQSDTGGACTSDADCLSTATASYCNPYAGGKCSPGLNFSAGGNSCNDYGGTGSTTGFAGSGGSDAGGTAGSTGAAGSDGGGAGGAAGSDAASDSDAASTD
jgi:hypothetical protein